MKQTDDEIKQLQDEIENTFDQFGKARLDAIVNLQYKLLESNCINCKKPCNGDRSWAWSGVLSNDSEILHDPCIYEHKISGFVICPDCNKLGYLAEYRGLPKRWEWVLYDGSAVIPVK